MHARAFATTLLMALWSTVSLAQSAPPAAKPPPRPGMKPMAMKPTAKAPPAPVLPAAGSEQIASAELAHYGEYQCEFGELVTVERTPKHEGYVDVKHRKIMATMKPVVSSTGAVRLEDVKGRLLMLQIANKSMLMDTKIGQRLVDGCVHEKQREFASLPASGPGLGIEAKEEVKKP